MTVTLPDSVRELPRLDDQGRRLPYGSVSMAQAQELAKRLEAALADLQRAIEEATV